VEGFCSLVSCLVRDPVGEVVDSATPVVLRRGALEPWVLRVLASCLGLGGCLVTPIPTLESCLGVHQRSPIDREPMVSVEGVGAAPEAVVGPPCQ
jgi:hypothetical protein